MVPSAGARPSRVPNLSVFAGRGGPPLKKAERDVFQRTRAERSMIDALGILTFATDMPSALMAAGRDHRQLHQCRAFAGRRVASELRASRKAPTFVIPPESPAPLPLGGPRRLVLGLPSGWETTSYCVSGRRRPANSPLRRQRRSICCTRQM
jgi:hypothetical protein